MPQPPLPLDHPEIPVPPGALAIILQQVPWSGDTWRTQVQWRIGLHAGRLDTVASDEWSDIQHDVLPSVVSDVVSAYLYAETRYDVTQAIAGGIKLSRRHARTYRHT